MTRYLVFVFEAYEARGGAHDCEGAFDTLEKAKAAAKALRRKHIESYCGGADDGSVHAHVLEVGKTLTAHHLMPDGIYWQTQDV